MPSNLSPLGNITMRFIAAILMLCNLFSFQLVSAADSLVWKLPAPQINSGSWVLIEIWPDVKDITLAAYFLDASEKKNQSLCEAAKRVFDSDQDVKSKASGKKLSSYRLCLSVGEATARGYIHEA
jgi:phage-related minor tail protein